MLILSAIVWLGLYLHAAAANVVLRLNGQALPRRRPGRRIVRLRPKFDVGDAPALTYGFDADGFAAAGSGWRVAPGDEWTTTIGFDAAGGLVVSNAGGDVREYAWLSAVVIPEPGAAGAAAFPVLATRRRAVRQP
jgi:hypothetical protein